MINAAGYSPDRFQAFSIDVWDGDDINSAIFLANSRITYPYLLMGGAAGIPTDYDCTYDLVFVIGGDGVIIFRGLYEDTAVQAAIDRGIADLDAPSAVTDTPAAASRLLDGYPNPFNPRIRIPYELGGGPGKGTVRVTLQILDLRGRVVKTLVDGRQRMGLTYQATWNGTDESGRRMPSGAYMSRLTVDGRAQAGMLTLVK